MHFFFKVCIFPGFIAAGAGAVEAVMTMEEVNDRTETENEAPNQYLFALSLGNAIAALYGTIGGGANIPMSVLALEAGANGRFRISGIVAGFTVFLFVMVAAPLIKIITVSSLIGLMVAVILATMDWGSIWFVVLALLPQSCREHPQWLAAAEKYPGTFNCVHYTSCNYRKKLFLFVHSSFNVFSVITASKQTQTVYTNLF